VQVLVTGVAGLLGNKVFEVLRRRFPGTRGTMRAPAGGDDVIGGFDARDLDGVRAALRRLRPAVVVNCVGVIKQRPAASDPVACIAVNALFPHALAETLREWDGRLIHVSTDCVFSGARGGYTEEDLPDAADLYGRSKALGEVTAGRALTLRTSFIGRERAHHDSLLDWFLAQRGQVRGFTRAVFSGVTTNHLAGFIGDVIADHPTLSGLHHLAAAPIAKHDLLRLLREAFRVDVEIVPDDSVVHDRSLCADKLAAAIGHRPPSWQSLIAELAAEPAPR
jgi:dTDP-4-dehydrorhamnose reductase